MVFVPGVDGRVYAVDAATGTLRWRSAPTFGLSPYGADSPVAAGTVVCAVGDDRALYGLDSATGTPRWRLLPDGGVIGPLTAIDTTVYAASVDGLIHAVDAQSGRQQWTGAGGTLVAGAPPAAGGPLVAAAPPAAGGLVIVGGPALASGVDRTSGTVRWRTYGSDPLTAGPTSGLLYVTIEESLYALDPGTGRPVWVAYVRNLALGVPVTGTAAVFVAGNYGAGSSGNYLGGTLYAFDAPGSG
jgi:outer membrane protein assembly factor BamB